MADFLLDRLGAVLIIFAACAAVAGTYTPKPAERAAAGLIAVLLAMVIPISERSLFEWLVSTVERASAPGFVLMIVFAIAAVTGRNYRVVPEFRFATALLALGGFLLYPGALGFIDFDSYVLGYSGYLLPLLLAAILAYAIYRRYLLVVLSINAGILAFLLGVGRSLNLWDYVIDPVAWALAIGSWVAIAIDMRRRATARAARPAVSPIT